ncbi:agmatinase [soil metagenome]
MTKRDLFLGATAASSAEGFGAAIFGAPHGTPYKDVDNRIHAETANTLRAALAADREMLESWDFDFGGPLLGTGGFRLADLGDLSTAPLDGAGNRHQITGRTREILGTGAVPIMIGGDDSTPIPFIAGFADHGPVTILQIDAHIDWRDERFGERWGFSSTMRRASEMAHVKGMVQAGMRGMGSAREGEVRAARAWGDNIVTAGAVHRDGVGPVLDLIPYGARVLITFDCDALDSAVMPAVSYPTPGGLGYQQVIDLIAGVSAKAEIAGFDLVEFVPARDPDGRAAFTAARIICNVIGALAKR